MSASSRGSKNASSIAYVHVPRSRSPKRNAGLSKSFRGRCFRISVSSLMVICPEVSVRQNSCTKRRLCVGAKQYPIPPVLSISCVAFSCIIPRHRWLCASPDSRILPQFAQSKAKQSKGHKRFLLISVTGNKCKYYTRILYDTENTASHSALKVHRARRTLNGLRGLLSSGLRPSAASRRPAS